ncbi:hypothetical protein RR46_13169 [Papilio xuthus]|uniref:Uncharacterized protein n=1 Tax=Papilio xuthus TaxID=66420 RepID=A0A194PMP4_PAPXU|nr:hypothetical protein RR46_13169 [Papilio xuthus]
MYIGHPYYFVGYAFEYTAYDPSEGQTSPLYVDKTSCGVVTSYRRPPAARPRTVRARLKKVLVAQHPRVDRGCESRPTFSPRKRQGKIWRTDRQPSLVGEAPQEEEPKESQSFYCSGVEGYSPSLIRRTVVAFMHYRGSFGCIPPGLTLEEPTGFKPEGDPLLTSHKSVPLHYVSLRPVDMRIEFVEAGDSKLTETAGGCSMAKAPFAPHNQCCH